MQWQVKDISFMTGVSVQTLHHYDRIGLLVPAHRQDSGYRLYSEEDLLKLQQIIALKYFGFKLSQIKTILEGDVELLPHFALQSEFLAEKAKTLLDASNMLNNLVSGMQQNSSIPWETIIKLIEIYQMTQKLEESWASKVLSPEELTQYATFKAELKSRFTAKEKQDFDKAWGEFIVKVETNMAQPPQSETGIKLAAEMMQLVNTLYGDKHANLKHAIWEKGFKQGHGGGEHELSPEMITWLDQATDAYYRERIYTLLDTITPTSPKPVEAWDAIMHEMYGDAEDLKQAVVHEGLNDSRVSDAAKAWLHTLHKS